MTVLNDLSTLDQVVTLTVRVSVQEMTISSQKFPPTAWSFLLSLIQEMLINRLTRVSVTPNQQRTHELRDEVLSVLSAKDMDTSGYQVSDLDEFDFYREKDQLHK